MSEYGQLCIGQLDISVDRGVPYRALYCHLDMQHRVRLVLVVWDIFQTLQIARGNWSRSLFTLVIRYIIYPMPT